MKQWIVSKFDKDKVREFETNYGLPAIVALFLVARGINTDEMLQEFLYGDGAIDDPFEIKDMDRAAERVHRAIDSGEKICIYGDYDVDGITSTALLYSYLKTVGADVIYYIPHRENEGYGMNKSAVDVIKDKGVNLIITVDNGVSAADEIDYAKSLGIDTVVTDHHIVPEKLPNAVAVVDPHRPDCESRFKEISGVGVTFKLVMALEGEYCDVDIMLDNYSDLLCIGVIGDVVKIADENLVFLKRGLQSINNSDRVGIQALIKEIGFEDKYITSIDISFAVIPKMNAVGRIDYSDICVKLLTTEDETEASEIAKILCDKNIERKNLENEILSEINQKIVEDRSIICDNIIVVDGDYWAIGVIGIVSNKIKNIYGKPCVVISRCGDKARGSGRSVEGFDLWKAIESCSDLLNHFGGHPMAAGFDISSDKIDEFRQKINAYADSLGEMPLDTLKIDCKLSPEFIDVELAKDLLGLKFYGDRNTYPVFQLSNLRILRKESVSNGSHTRIYLSRGSTRISAIYFGMPFDSFPYNEGDTVDIAVELLVNVYRNVESLTIKIIDIKFSDVDNAEHIHSLRLYEKFCRGNELTREQLLSIIPTKTECRQLIIYLMGGSIPANISLPVIARRLGGNMTCAKLKVALEAFKELGIITLYEDIHKIEIRSLNTFRKVKLEDAKIFKKLGEVFRNGKV